MDQKLEQLATIADTLPKTVKANAKALVERMGTKIEGIGDEALEWRAPMAKLVQPTSDRSKQPKGAGIGDIVIGENIAKQPIKIAPIRVWDSRQMWSPDKDDNRILCWSPDGITGNVYGLCKTCEFGKFDKDANRSACNKAKTAIVVTDDLSEVFSINFTKTNYKNGLDWMSMMRTARLVPFKRIYELKSKTNEKFKQVESLFVETKNENTPEEHLPFLEALFKKFGEDRELFIKKFYENVETRQAQTPPALADNSENVKVLEAPATTEQSSLAKKYSM